MHTQYEIDALENALEAAKAALEVTSDATTNYRKLEEAVRLIKSALRNATK